MNENVRIFRVRIVEHEVQEYIELTKEEYDELTDELGFDMKVERYHQYSMDIRDALDSDKYHDAWITDWSEPVGDSIAEVWVGSQDE